MRKLRRLRDRKHKPTGTPDYLNIGVCLLMVIYNLIDLIYKGMTGFDYFIYLAPYIIYPILNIIFRTKKITAGLYFLVGFLTLSLDPINSGASGLLYIYFSYNEIKNNRWGIVLITFSYIALSIRFMILNTMGSEAIVSILLFTFIFATLYFKVIDHNKKRVDLWKEISEKEKAILKLFMNGKDYSQISHILNINDKKESIRTSITRCRIKSGCDNDIQFGIWLSDKG